MAESRFHQQLRQQLTFVQNSCDAYDRGQIEEAIRIGTSLRVILHDTRNSISLLTHLGSKDIDLLSTCPVQEIKANTIFFDCFSGFSAQGVKPKLGVTSSKIGLPALDWWDQIVIGRNPDQYLTRKVIALTAANKDGGAHVDAKLPDEYNQLIHGIWGKLSLEGTFPLADQHLLCLRQMGYEILNSPHLVKLAA
jgi:hypothetical protein